MNIVLGPAGPKTTVDVLAVLVTEDELARDEVVSEFDHALGGGLRKIIKQEEWTGKKDTQLVLPTYGKLGARKLVLIGLGASKDLREPEVRIGAVKAVRVANAEKAESLAVILHRGADAGSVRVAAEGIVLGSYRFDKYLTGDRRPKKQLGTVTLTLRSYGKAGARASKQELDALEAGIAVGQAVNLVRDLVNEPANEMTPAQLANVAQEVAAKGELKITVLDRKQIIAAGMKLLDAVGRGSRNEQRFVHMTYAPAKARKGRKRVVVVGKGLTFDSGGLCIKQAQGMGDMKCDMAGAALSVGIMAAVSALKPDVEVHGIFAAAENMPDGNAYRPGDIFGSLDGKTVEIVNTDAEGRLVLADALSYATRLKPDVLIDHATLTGACMIALGTLTAGLYSNDDELAAAYLAAAKSAGESMWRMPLLEELRESLKSEVADLKHTGDRYGGSITAALFLREFIGESKWVHLDIAGPAFLDRQTALSPKGATGFGLLTLVRFIEGLQS
uniref:Probable cytosol aminopeptidase n=1 Tax=uncultured delta proteobacterium TaxID=34034 RepID=H5SLM7_9DELT|nr:leucine aminopeptidase [uncultured delta proteobacterium]